MQEKRKRNAKGHFIKGTTGNAKGRPRGTGAVQRQKKAVQAIAEPMPFKLELGASPKEIMAANSKQFLAWAFRRALTTPDTALGGKMALLLANKMLPDVTGNARANGRTFQDMAHVPLWALRKMAKGVQVEEADYMQASEPLSSPAGPAVTITAPQQPAPPVSRGVLSSDGDAGGAEVVRPASRPAVGEDREAVGVRIQKRGGG